MQLEKRFGVFSSFILWTGLMPLPFNFVVSYHLLSFLVNYAVGPIVFPLNFSPSFWIQLPLCLMIM